MSLKDDLAGQPQWALFQACGSLHGARQQSGRSVPNRAALSKHLAERGFFSGGAKEGAAWLTKVFKAGPDSKDLEDGAARLEALLDVLPIEPAQLVEEAKALVVLEGVLGPTPRWAAFRACGVLRNRRKDQGKQVLKYADIAAALGLGGKQPETTVSHALRVGPHGKGGPEADGRCPMRYALLLPFTKLCELELEEVKAEATRILRVVQFQKNAESLPALSGRADPHTILLQWAFAKNLDVTLGGLYPDIECTNIQLDHTLGCPMLLQPNRSKLQLGGDSTVPDLWTPFRYASGFELEREARSSNSVQMLSDWHFALNPNFVLVESESHAQASGTSKAKSGSSMPAELSSLAIGDADNVAGKAAEFDDPQGLKLKLANYLRGRSFLVHHDSRREAQLRKLLEWAGVEYVVAPEEPPKSAREGSYARIFWSYRTFAELRQLSAGVIHSDYIVVCGAPEFWAIHCNRDCGLRVIVTDEGLRAFCGARKDLQSTDWSRERFYLADPTTEVKDEFRRRLCAAFFQKASAELKRIWNDLDGHRAHENRDLRRRIISEVGSVYRDYGGPGVDFKDSYLDTLISQGMTMVPSARAQDPEGELSTADFEPFEIGDQRSPDDQEELESREINAQPLNRDVHSGRSRGRDSELTG